MKITVVVADLIKEIEDGLTNYEKEYKQLLKLYLKKEKEYMEYVEKHIQAIEKGENPSDLKYSPSAPSWLRNNFVDLLEALKAHKEATIIMDDQEYTNARHGVQRLRQDVSASTTALMNISY